MTDGQDRTDELTADAIRANAIVPTGRLRGLSVMPPGPPSRLVVDGFATVHRDGRIEYGDGYGPDDASRAFWDAVGWRAREGSATSSERPDCATTIREAGEVTTEVRLLALPSEPPVGSEVEMRSADGYREGTWASVDDPRTCTEERHTRRWAPSTIPGARWGQRWSWRALCEWAIRFDLELWLTREGPAEADPNA